MQSQSLQRNLGPYTGAQADLKNSMQHGLSLLPVKNAHSASVAAILLQKRWIDGQVGR